MKSRLFIKQLIGALIFFSLLFVSAGHLDYWQGCVYVGIGVIMIILNYTIFQLDEDLMMERSKPGKGVKKWDKIILMFSFVLTIGMFVIAGLDSGRHHWSPNFNWQYYALGILFTIGGQLIFLIAQKQNKFFSSVVRIQKNRNHEVCDTGLYKTVRHPAYLGSLIQTIGFPLLFGSLWAIIPVGAQIIVLFIRTSLEDRVLVKELSGYYEYSKKVVYRIIPFIW